jgi:hypothetical protein
VLDRHAVATRRRRLMREGARRGVTVGDAVLRYAPSRRSSWATPSAGSPTTAFLQRRPSRRFTRLPEWAQSESATQLT